MQHKHLSIISIIVLLIVIGVMNTPTRAQVRVGGPNGGANEPPQAAEAGFTANFESEPSDMSVNFFSLLLGGEVFHFIFTNEGDGWVTRGFSHVPASGQGGSGAIEIRSAGYQLSTIERINIEREDGGDFLFNSIYIRADQDSEPVTVTGYYNGVQVGEAMTVDRNDEATLNFAGLVVDQVSLTSRHFGSTYMDTFAGDTAVSKDFGDLPQGYGMTSESQDGARHALGAIYLGGCVDAEPDGQTSTTADGDDLDVGNPIQGACLLDDDEDGVIPIDDWQEGPDGGELQISVTGGDGCLSGWIDWDDDGSFMESGDQIFDMMFLSSGQHNLSIDVPDGVLSGADPVPLYTRFRLVTDSGSSSDCSDDPPLGLTGPAGSGEVEDYLWSFQPTAITLADFQLGVKWDADLLFALVVLLAPATAVSAWRVWGRVKS